jgi:hypothetical protein
MLTPDDKATVQQIVVKFLERESENHPTLLLDTLLSGDGWQLVHTVLSQQEAYSRQMADTLRRLLNGMLPDRMPPQQAPPGPYPMPPAPGVPRGE